MADVKAVLASANPHKLAELAAALPEWELELLGAREFPPEDGETLLDLDYEEDSSAEVDLNVVMTGEGRLVEVQATAERAPFDREALNELLDVGADGIAEIVEAQKAALDAAG